MAIEVTNTKASQALNGQAVTVTVSGAESISKLPNINVGDLAEVGTSGVEGLVSSVDYKGHSFKVTPLMPNQSFSSTAGYLAVNAKVNL